MIETGGGESYSSREDPAHIERHIDETRHAVDRTLGELQSRLSVRRRMSAALDGLTPPATMSARLTLENGKVKVIDGPFPEAKEVIGGVWIIDVKSREEALKWASRIPGPGSEMVEVRRLFDASDFGAEAQQKLAEFDKQVNETAQKMVPQ